MVRVMVYFHDICLNKMTPGSSLIMIEANKDFVRHLKESINDSRAVVHNVLAGDVWMFLIKKTSEM
jgi:phospholipid N-methyltransferase